MCHLRVGCLFYTDAQLAYMRYSIAPYIPYQTNKRNKVARYCPVFSCRVYYKSSNGLLILSKLCWLHSPHPHPRQPNDRNSAKRLTAAALHLRIRAARSLWKYLREAFAVGER
ncbi:MAG TPA: hypothetical protein DEB17_09140 [Chlorobaculum sp.]|uniref:Uncharacterized protein n=1 Tax=Chlorobaculum tepidum (strain ATCC 49652 / DSM 12025 / NBRC 103806 / TLS) TaxID=194439 RepID=Q8KB73_CHLTE|nr:hypothetical protein CT1916 [Chlorobaculum tepidum TLS]HBU24131.1 hypothetical protein [Chlorobaculum sp.]